MLNSFVTLAQSPQGHFRTASRLEHNREGLKCNLTTSLLARAAFVRSIGVNLAQKPLKLRSDRWNHIIFWERGLPGVKTLIDVAQKAWRDPVGSKILGWIGTGLSALAGPLVWSVIEHNWVACLTVSALAVVEILLVRITLQKPSAIITTEGCAIFLETYSTRRRNGRCRSPNFGSGSRLGYCAKYLSLRQAYVCICGEF
jgi:hypothetical protein